MLKGASLPVASRITVVVALLLLDEALASRHNRTESASISLSQTCVTMFSTNDTSNVYKCNTASVITVLLGLSEAVFVELQSPFQLVRLMGAAADASPPPIFATRSVAIVVSACFAAATNGQAAIEINSAPYNLATVTVILRCPWVGPTGTTGGPSLVYVVTMPTELFQFVIANSGSISHRCAQQGPQSKRCAPIRIANGDGVKGAVRVELHGPYLMQCSNQAIATVGPFLVFIERNTTLNVVSPLHVEVTLFGVQWVPSPQTLVLGSRGIAGLVGFSSDMDEIGFVSIVMYMSNVILFQGLSLIARIPVPSTSPGALLNVSNVSLTLLMWSYVTLTGGASMMQAYQGSAINVRHIAIISSDASSLALSGGSSAIRSVGRGEDITIGVRGTGSYLSVVDPWSALSSVLCDSSDASYGLITGVALVVDGGAEVFVGAGASGISRSLCATVSSPLVPSDWRQWYRVTIVLTNNSGLRISDGAALLASTFINELSFTVSDWSRAEVFNQSSLIVASQVTSLASQLVACNSTRVLICNGSSLLLVIEPSPRASGGALPPLRRRSKSHSRTVSQSVSLDVAITAVTLAVVISSKSLMVMGGVLQSAVVSFAPCASAGSVLVVPSNDSLRFDFSDSSIKDLTSMYALVGLSRNVRPPAMVFFFSRMTVEITARWPQGAPLPPPLLGWLVASHDASQSPRVTLKAPHIYVYSESSEYVCVNSSEALDCTFMWISGVILMNRSLSGSLFTGCNVLRAANSGVRYGFPRSPVLVNTSSMYSALTTPDASCSATVSKSISMSCREEYSTADGDPTDSTAPLLLVHDCGNTSADIRLLVAGGYPQRNVTLEVRSMFRSLTVSAAGHKAAVGSVTIVLSACSWASMDGVGIQVLSDSYVMEELHVLMNCSWIEPQTSQQQMGWLTKQLMVVNQMPRSVFRFVVLEQARATKMCSMQQSFMSMSLITYVAMGTRPSDYPTLQILLEIRGLYRGACSINNPNSYPDGGPFFFTLFGEVSDKPPSVSLTIGAAGSVMLIGRPGSHPSSLLHLRNNSVFSSSPLGVSVSLSSLRVELLPRGTINMKMSAAVLLVGYRNEVISADASIAWVANVEVIGWPSSLLYVGQSSSLIQSAYYTMRPIRLVNWTVFANGMNVSVAGGALFADVYEIESVCLTLTNGSVGVLSLPGSCIFAVCQGVLCERTAYVRVTLTIESGSRLEIGAGCPGLASVPAAPSPHYGVGCWVRLRVTVNEHSALTISNGSSLLAASSVNGVSIAVMNGSNVIIRSQMSALVVGTRLLSVAVVCRMLSSLAVEDTSSVVVVNGTLPVTSATHSPSLSVIAPLASGNASSTVGRFPFVTLSDIHRATVTFELTDSSTLVMGNFTNVLLIQARGEALLPGYSSFSVRVEASTVALSTQSSPVYYSWLRVGMAVVFWTLDIDFRRSVLEYTAPVGTSPAVLSVGYLWVMSLDFPPNQTSYTASPSPISTITAVGTVITCHVHYIEVNASLSLDNVLLFRWMSSPQSAAGGAVVNNSNYSSVFSGCSRISVVQHTHTAAANETTSTQTFGIPRHALFRVAPPTVLTTTAFLGCSATDSVSTSRSPSVSRSTSMSAGSRSTSSSQTFSDSRRVIPTAALQVTAASNSMTHTPTPRIPLVDMAPPPEATTVVVASVQAIGTTAAVASSLSGGGDASTANSLVLLSTVDCGASSRGTGPATLAVSGAALSQFGRYGFVAMVFGNIGLIVVLIGTHWLVAKGVDHRHRFARTGDSSSSGVVFVGLSLRTLKSTRFPSLSLQSIDLLLPSVLFGSSALLSLNIASGGSANAGEVVAGLLCAVVVAALVALKSVLLLRYVLRSPNPLSQETAHLIAYGDDICYSAQRMCPALPDTLLYPSEHWGPKSLQRMFGSLFSKFRAARMAVYFGPVELCVPLVASLICVVAAFGRAQCIAGVVLLTAMYGGVAVAVAVAQPMRFRWNNIVVCAQYGGFALMCVLKAASAPYIAIDIVQLLETVLLATKIVLGVWLSMRERDWAALQRATSSACASLASHPWATELASPVVRQAPLRLGPEEIIIVHEMPLMDIAAPKEVTILTSAPAAPVNINDSNVGREDAERHSAAPQSIEVDKCEAVTAGANNNSSGSNAVPLLPVAVGLPLTESSDSLESL